MLHMSRLQTPDIFPQRVDRSTYVVHGRLFFEQTGVCSTIGFLHPKHTA